MILTDGIGLSMRETVRVIDGEFFYSGLRFKRVNTKIDKKEKS